LVIFAMACALMGAGAKTGSAAILLAAGAVMALGAMPVILTVTSLIVAAAPAERAGSASAMSETSSELGGAMGIAVLGSFATFLYRNAAAAIDIPALPETAAAAARTTMAAAADEAAKRGIIDAPWLSQAQEAYANSVALTGLVAALCLLALALLAWRVFKGPGRQEGASPNE
jgi:DHA2 family multidrug resistance protein-like MFS transporter